MVLLLILSWERGSYIRDGTSGNLGSVQFLSNSRLSGLETFSTSISDEITENISQLFRPLRIFMISDSRSIIITIFNVMDVKHDAIATILFQAWQDLN